MEPPGFPALVQRLLRNRGIGSPADAERFFTGTTEHDPLALPDAPVALGRLRQAIHEGERIAVFGDFDVDGITATAILSEGIRQLGGTSIPYIPDRFREGYGLSTGAVRYLHDRGARVLITADCGTSNREEIEVARSLGLDVIVVDHHSVPAQLPEATALVNPKRPGNGYPFADLSTGGLAYKLLQGLSEACGRSNLADAYLDLAALSTVCDMVPLVDENRTIVRRGLARLRRSERPGIQALCRAAGTDIGRIEVVAVGFQIGPRLNAAGRMAHARTSLDLLLTEDPEEAERLAGELDGYNQERRRQTEAAFERAVELLDGEERTAPLIMIGDDTIPAGVVGIVAGRLVEAYYRPAIVYEQGPVSSRGSCRSISEFDIVAALRSCDGLFQKYGGHPQAAGFTADTARLPLIKEKLIERARTELRTTDLSPVVEIDAAFPLRRLRGEEVRWLSQFTPCGIGNPEPTLLSSGVTVLECRPVGDGGKHLRLKLRDGHVTWPAIAFGQSIGNLEPGHHVDVVYTVAQDRDSSDGLQLQVRDFRPHSGNPSP